MRQKFTRYFTSQLYRKLLNQKIITKLLFQSFIYLIFFLIKNNINNTKKSIAFHENFKFLPSRLTKIFKKFV